MKYELQSEICGGHLYEKYVWEIELKLSKYLECSIFAMKIHTKCVTTKCKHPKDGFSPSTSSIVIAKVSLVFFFRNIFFRFVKRPFVEIYHWILIMRTCLELNMYTQQFSMNVNFKFQKRSSHWSNMNKFRFVLLKATKYPKKQNKF